MKLRRILSCVMALLLVSSLPLTAFADTWYLEDGDVTVSATESGQTVSQGETSKNDDAPVITQKDSTTSTTNTITIKAEENATANVTIQDVNIVISDPADNPQDHSGQAAVTIDVAENAEANVTLDGVNINTKNTGGESINYETGEPVEFDGEAAVQITGNGDVTLELDGNNTVQGGYDRAGVEKNTTAATETEAANGTGNLTITDENGTAGSLEATGGLRGAGIGGGDQGDGSNITITGSAEVNATGGKYGAGIGGGTQGDGSNITITGSAEVNAQGGSKGAGIGGGSDGSGSDITITGSAEVTAQGGEEGAGIGGGSLGDGSNITITGSAEVTAIGGERGAGIGSGYQANFNATGSNITVSGDAQVKAQGGNDNHLGSNYYGAGAAIGDGGKYSNSSPDNIAGEEKAVNTDDLNEGWVATYAPGTTDLDSATPDSLTYKDSSGKVQTAETENITLLPAQSATDDTHEQKAGFKVGDVEVAVKTHRYGNYEPDKEATCTHEGTESAKCTVPGCTAKLERTIPGSMKQHEFVNYVPDADNLATCTEAGTKTAKCEHCTATNTIPDPAKGHSMGEYYTTLEATCQAKGVERRDCDNCDYYETRDLNIVDHSYGDYTSDNNATCTSDGTKTRKCIWCGLKDTVHDPGTMKEHSFTNYISNNDATYDADGTKTAVCDHCDASDTIPDPGSRLVREEIAPVEPLYRVLGQDGKALACKTEQSSGVLTITVEADFASLTGKLSGIRTLKAQGIDTIVFVTNGASSTFALSDLLAQGGDGYTLTHDGEKVTFTLSSGADIGKILK